MKKILEHLDLWDVKRKPAPRAYSPPSESSIIYDEALSPSVGGHLTPLKSGLKPTSKKTNRG